MQFKQKVRFRFLYLFEPLYSRFTLIIVVLYVTAMDRVHDPNCSVSNDIVERTKPKHVTIGDIISIEILSEYGKLTRRVAFEGADYEEWRAPRSNTRYCRHHLCREYFRRPRNFDDCMMHGMEHLDHLVSTTKECKTTSPNFDAHYFKRNPSRDFFRRPANFDDCMMDGVKHLDHPLATKKIPEDSRTSMFCCKVSLINSPMR